MDSTEAVTYLSPLFCIGEVVGDATIFPASIPSPDSPVPIGDHGGNELAPGGDRNEGDGREVITSFRPTK